MTRRDSLPRNDIDARARAIAERAAKRAAPKVAKPKPRRVDERRLSLEYRREVAAIHGLSVVPYSDPVEVERGAGASAYVPCVHRRLAP